MDKMGDICGYPIYVKNSFYEINPSTYLFQFSLIFHFSYFKLVWYVSISQTIRFSICKIIEMDCGHPCWICLGQVVSPLYIQWFPSYKTTYSEESLWPYMRGGLSAGRPQSCYISMILQRKCLIWHVVSVQGGCPRRGALYMHSWPNTCA